MYDRLSLPRKRSDVLNWGRPPPKTENRALMLQCPKDSEFLKTWVEHSSPYSWSKIYICIWVSVYICNSIHSCNRVCTCPTNKKDAHLSHDWAAVPYPLSLFGSVTTILLFSLVGRHDLIINHRAFCRQCASMTRSLSGHITLSGDAAFSSDAILSCSRPAFWSTTNDRFHSRAAGVLRFLTMSFSMPLLAIIDLMMLSGIKDFFAD